MHMAYKGAMGRRELQPISILTALFMAACGGGSDEEPTTTAPQAEEGRAVTGDADSDDVDVIDAWSDALRKGDVDAAAEFFAIPSVAENGAQLIRIRDRDDARLFNLSLPCGAVLIEAETQGDFTTATFKLTERPGPGLCGPGTGHTAQTSFVIEDGKIVEWRRVAISGPDSAPGQAA